MPPPRQLLRVSKHGPPPATKAVTPGGPAGPGLDTPGGFRAKKPTVAFLAGQLESLSAALPALTARLEQMDARQQDLSDLVASPHEPPPSPWGPTPKLPAAKSLLGSPPPTRVPELVAAQEQELQDLQDQTEESAQDPLAQAMLAQSQALTSLVSQLAAASGEPLLDLAGSGSVGVRGASQRANVQDELAQGKGTFFTQVLSNLARRMQPALQHASSPGNLLRKGYSLSRYWERFGGWSAS